MKPLIGDGMQPLDDVLGKDDPDARWFFIEDDADSDDDLPRPPIYVHYINGVWGAWVEFYRTHPNNIDKNDDTSYIADATLNLDFFEGALRLRFFADGAMKAAGTEDIEPTRVIHILNVEK